MTAKMARVCDYGRYFSPRGADGSPQDIPACTEQAVTMVRLMEAGDVVERLWLCAPHCEEVQRNVGGTQA